jgi:Methyltransferase domain
LDSNFVGPGASPANGGTTGHFARLEAYKDKVVEFFPVIPRACIDTWALTDVDALALRRFLESYPVEGKARVLEIGAFVGVSTFHLASQQKVSKVLSVDINPTLADALVWCERLTGVKLDLETVRHLRVLDVAGAVIKHFPDQRQKVDFVSGTVESVDLPASTDGTPLVAFVDGDHRKRAVKTDLHTIFENNPLTVAILHDCLGNHHAPSVLAAVTTFLQGSQREYSFRLFRKLTSKRRPNLGVVYPQALADQVEKAAAELLVDPTLDMLRARSQIIRLRRRLRELERG